MEKKAGWNKRIEIPHEKELVRVILVMFTYYWLLYIYDVTTAIPTWFWTNLATSGLNILITLPYIFVYFKWVRSEPKINRKEKKQYYYVPVLLLLTLANFYIQSQYFYGEVSISFAGLKELGIITIIYYFVHYIFIVAVSEEFMSRILIQNDLVSILGKLSFLAPLLSAAYFGFIHSVQRDTEHVICAFVFGLLLGYAKYIFKKCTFVTLVLVHGLYDFLIMLL